MLRNFSGTSFTQRDNKQIVLGGADFGQFKAKLLAGGFVETATKETVLDTLTVAFETFGNSAKPFRVANVIPNQVPSSHWNLT